MSDETRKAIDGWVALIEQNLPAWREISQRTGLSLHEVLLVQHTNLLGVWSGRRAADEGDRALARKLMEKMEAEMEDGEDWKADHE